MDTLNSIDAFFGWPTGVTALCVAALCGVCAFVAAFMPAPDASAGVVYRTVYAVINKLGQNYGKAANADEIGFKKLKG